MKKDLKLYWKLFTSTFSLSAFTFGGGFVIAPLMKRKFVDELKWVEDKEILDLVALAQSSPGPIAVNASILIGYRIAGIAGTLIATLGTVLPPLIILTIISMFYQAFRENVVVKAVLKGMQAGVAAVIIDVVISMGGSILKQKEILSALVMAGAFIATYFYKVNIIFIILVCGVIGAVSTNLKTRRKAGP